MAPGARRPWTCVQGWPASQPCTVWRRPPTALRALVAPHHRAAEFEPRLEARALVRRHGHHLPGLPPTQGPDLTRLDLAHVEGAEAGERDALPLLERVSDRIEHGVESP